MHANKEPFLRALQKQKIPKNIIEAFDAIDQGLFFDPVFRKKLYTGDVIPIGFGEISDPPVALAKMLKHLALKKSWRVLEIGTGSGYSTALLSRLAGEVVTIELSEELALSAKKHLLDCGVSNVRQFAGSGTEFDAPLGMFDAVIVCAACRKRPLPLVRRLKARGKMVFPMGPEHQQQICVLLNETDDAEKELFKTSFHEFCEFGPLQGKYGWLP